MDAVLLDMDGTLVDSDASVERAWEDGPRSTASRWPTCVPGLHGSPAEHHGPCVRLPTSTTTRSTGRCGASSACSTTTWPTLRAAGRARAAGHAGPAGLPWAVVTSADRRLAKARLGAAGIDPPLLVTIEDSPRGKPFPDPYLVAARRLGVEPTRCLVVEDSQPGIDAGHAAGAAVAALRGLSAELSLTSLVELTSGWRRG